MSYLVPGAQGVSEWLSPIHGFIKSCVEASEAVITGIVGVLPTTPQTTDRLALDQIARGEAGYYGGASNYASAGAQLARLGIPNTVLGPSWTRAHNWTSAINAALEGGRPVLAGVPNAAALRDTVTGATPDRGVRGHALTIVGADRGSYLVADPNTPQGAGFMHYSPQTLRNAGLDSLVIPSLPAGAVQGITNTAPSALPSVGPSALPSMAPFSGGGGSTAVADWLRSMGVNVPAGTQDSQLQPGPATPVGIVNGISGWIGGLFTDIGLGALGLILVAVGVTAFLFLGGGRGATVEVVKSAAIARGQRAGKGGA